jgi:hypothetical protein
MSKTWTIIVYSAVGLVSSAAIFVAGHVVGARRARKQDEEQQQPKRQTSEVAQA